MIVTKKDNLHCDNEWDIHMSVRIIAMVTFWLCKSISPTNCVFHIPREVGALLQAYVLMPANLTSLAFWSIRFSRLQCEQEFMKDSGISWYYVIHDHPQGQDVWILILFWMMECCFDHLHVIIDAVSWCVWFPTLGDWKNVVWDDVVWVHNLQMKAGGQPNLNVNATSDINGCVLSRSTIAVTWNFFELLSSATNT